MNHPGPVGSGVARIGGIAKLDKAAGCQKGLMMIVAGVSREGGQSCLGIDKEKPNSGEELTAHI